MRELLGCNTGRITRELNPPEANLWVWILRTKQSLSEPLGERRFDHDGVDTRLAA